MITAQLLAQQVVEPDNAHPGFGAFIAFAVLAVIVVLLALLMSRQMRRVDEHAAVDEAVEKALAKQREAEESQDS